MGMIGSVGGTFGLFIGFSVTGFISSVVEFLKKFKCTRRIQNSGNKKISKSDGNSMEMENNDDNQTQILNDFPRDIIQEKQVIMMKPGLSQVRPEVRVFWKTRSPTFSEGPRPEQDRCQTFGEGLQNLSFLTTISPEFMEGPETDSSSSSPGLAPGPTIQAPNHHYRSTKTMLNFINENRKNPKKPKTT